MVSTRSLLVSSRCRPREQREDNFAQTAVPHKRETGKTVLGTQPDPLKQWEDSVMQTAVPHKKNPCSESITNPGLQRC